jgi:porin
MRWGRDLLRPLGAAPLLLWALPALAQTAAADQSAPPPTGFWERANLLGDLGGLRPALKAIGISFAFQEQSEVLGNVTGGIHSGAEYAGLTTASITLDTGQAFGWQGGTAFASALQIHGRNFDADNLATLQTVSNIDASRATRLWELWYQQELPGKTDLKLGQQSLDQEFITSQYSAVFLNAMMGWPALPSNDLYAGSPVYPLSALGVRLRARPTDTLTALFGVFDDNPPGGPFNDDTQLRGAEASGTRFNLTTGALWIGELQYAANASSPDKSCGSVLCGLPGTFKLGAWYDTGRFPDERFDGNGVSLASPGSTGVAALHRGNVSVYGVVDQMLWRDTAGARALGVFLRAMGAPDDRNLVDWSLDAGVNVAAPLKGRDNDTLGVGYGVAHVSDRAAALDGDRARFSGAAFAPRSAEHIIEVTYQAQLAPWWQVQPDFQYVFNPGGGIQNPADSAQRLGDEAVFGLRTTITF